MFSPVDPFSLTLPPLNGTLFSAAAKQSRHNMETATGKLAYSACVYPARAGLLALLLSVPNKSEITELQECACFHLLCQHEL